MDRVLKGTPLRVILRGDQVQKAWTFQANGLFTVWPFDPDLEHLNVIGYQVRSRERDCVLCAANSNLALIKWFIGFIKNMYKHFVALAGFVDTSDPYRADGIVIRFKAPTQYLDAILITVEAAVDACLDRATIYIQGSGGAVCGGQYNGQNGQNCQFP